MESAEKDRNEVKKQSKNSEKRFENYEKNKNSVCAS